MSAANIPEVISGFNVYSQGNKFIGVSSQITLAQLEAMTETISGMGIMGQYNTAIPGFTNAIEQDVPFRTIDDDIFSIMNPNSGLDLTYRAAQQSTVKSNYSLKYKQMRIVQRGRFLNFNPGNMELGKVMNAVVRMELFYTLIEIDGQTKLEYDKLNDVFTVNGVDLLARIRQYT